MTSPLRPSRRRADEFARMLDGGTAALAGADAALSPLVGLAEALRAVPLGPTPDFRAALRQRVVAVASIQYAGDAAVSGATARPTTDPIKERFAAWAVSWRGQRRIAVATAGVAAVVLVGGIGLAGSRSLPGDPFYDVKRSTEDAQLALTFGTEAKGERHLQFARERLDEVQRMVGDTQALRASASATGVSVLAAGAPTLGGSLTSRVIETLEDMDAETRQGTKDLMSVYNDSHDSHPLNTLQTFTRDQFVGIKDVYAALPVGAKPAAADSVKLLVTVNKNTQKLLGVQSCTEACASGGGATPGKRHDGGGSTGSPCTCTDTSTGTTGGTPTNPDGTDATPHPTLTPEPGAGGHPSGDGGTGGGSGGSTGGGPTPSPTKSTLQDQIGDILKKLPVPSLSPPPLPGPGLPPLLPKVSPLPTIHLP